MITLTETERATLGTRTQYRLARDGDRDLTVTGWRLAAEDDKRSRAGRGQPASDATRWTEVALYLTEGGRLVCARSHYTCWQGEREHHAAAVVDSPEAALTWLREDNRGQIGAASLAAWEAACSQVADLAAHETEVLD